MHKAREYFKTMNTMRWLKEVAEYIAVVAAADRYFYSDEFEPPKT
jgi:hypothetical protein